MEITPLLTCCCSFQGLGEPEQWLLDSCCLRAGSVNLKGTHLCISQPLQAGFAAHKSLCRVLAVEVLRAAQHWGNSDCSEYGVEGETSSPGCSS